MSRMSLENLSGLMREEMLKLEWLETNGVGGYASSTLLNCHTRKYHGLLVANLISPPGRHVVLSKFEDSICMKDQEFFLSFHQYPGILSPEGSHSLKAFHLNLYPEFIYQVGDICIHKAIMMVQCENCVLIRYEIKQGSASGLLRLKPFIAYRNHHSLTRENLFFHVKTFSEKNGFKMQPYDGMPSMFIQTNVKSKFYPAPVWYNNFEYIAEKERGYDWHEDLFQPGIFEIPIKKDRVVIIAASVSVSQEQLKRKWGKEEKRRARVSSNHEQIVGCFKNEDDKRFVRNLLSAGQQFLVKSTSTRPTIIAGYHWFNDWGRDTLISLPGLTFCCGHLREGTQVLISMGKYERKGLLPNYFSEHRGKENAYNTADTSLWYFWAVQQMLKYTGNLEIIHEKMWPVMQKILKYFMSGTLFNIQMAENGLLHTGNKDDNVTWMDAVVEGNPVTPRWGYAVEMNALWYNAICFAHELFRLFGYSESFFEKLIPKILSSFQETFWIDSESYLGDVSSNDCPDQSIRPNQILAVSLPYSPLTSQQQAGVVKTVQQHLLTPFGLRTLSPHDKEYKGRYEGDTSSRDKAYHQGTVWPWLLAHFGEAYLKTADDKHTAKLFLQQYLRQFLKKHLAEAGIGCISEIFDGDFPHLSRGCISQAWSTGEIIRLYTILNEVP